MRKILVIRLYFLLDALHVSDCICPSSGATFINCTSHLLYADTSGCCVTIARRIGIYQCDVQLLKVAPDDELI